MLDDCIYERLLISCIMEAEQKDGARTGTLILHRERERKSEREGSHRVHLVLRVCALGLVRPVFSLALIGACDCGRALSAAMMFLQPSLALALGWQ